MTHVISAREIEIVGERYDGDQKESFVVQYFDLYCGFLGSLREINIGGEQKEVC